MAGYIRANSAWRTLQRGFIYANGAWRTVQNGFLYANGAWRQFFSTATATYTFSFGDTIHFGTNGYISFDGGQSAINIASTTGRVLGILPADLELNSIRYAADSSRFYTFYRGKRLGGTDFEIEYEVHFIDGQDYALIKLIAFPSSTYSLTGYYVNGSSVGNSRITATRTVGAEYRVYFGTTAAFATSFTEYGTSTSPVWLAQSTLTSGNSDDGFISVVANQGSSPQAPTSVTASSITGSGATISWTGVTANINAGMSRIQSYDYSINGGSSWTSTGLTTSATITGLSGSTSYTVLVRANNFFFTGVNYGSVTFSTLSTLTAPTITSVTSGEAGGPVSVFFTGGSGPFFQMYWTSGVAPTVPVTADASGSASPLTDNTGPGSSGITWFAYVRSVATVGETSVGPSTLASAWSPGFSFTVTAPAPTVTSVTASSITSSTATISWSSTNQATYSITGLPDSYTGTTATSRAITGLASSTSYTATVTVANSDGTTASSSVSFTTSAPAPTPNISSITLTPGGSSTPFMTATWASTNTQSVRFSLFRSSSSAVNSPINITVSSGVTNNLSITTNAGGVNFYYQIILQPWSGLNETGTSGDTRLSGIKRNTITGGPTTYNF